MPQVFNLNFPEYKFALLFLHTTDYNFGKQKQQKRTNGPSPVNK